MKLAAVILAVIGTALAASIDNEVAIPPFRSMEVEVPEKSDSALRIVNGREVIPHSIPYQVYLVVRNTLSSWTCGGSLITASFVLTSARCLDTAESVDITLGAHDLRLSAEGQYVIGGRDWKIHESYDVNTIVNDIAVVRLGVPAPLSSIIGLARLPTWSDVGANLVGLNAQVSGWGWTSGAGPFSNYLLAVNNSIISNEQCNASFGIVTDDEVCLSGSGGSSSCKGDTGGPLILGNTQIGIVSYGIQGCMAGFPTVFTRISQFLVWIQTHTDYVI